MPIKYKKRKNGLYGTSFIWHGKQIPVTAKRWQDLDAKVAAKKAALAAQETCVDARTTVSQWSAVYLQHYTKSGEQLRARGLLSNIICPQIGYKPVHCVLPLDCQHILTQLAQADTDAQGRPLPGGYSRDQIVKVRRLLYNLFARAVENKLRADNPAAHLELPDTKQAGSHRSMTSRERQIFFTACTIAPHSVFLWPLFLLCTGLRPEETPLLTGRDLRGGMVDVSRAINWKTNQPKQTKSAAGVRQVPIPALLAAQLPALQPYDYLFPQRDRSRQRRPIPGLHHTKTSLRTLWRDFLTYMEQAEAQLIASGVLSPLQEPVPQLTPYDLRHTYCTDLARAGVPLVTASRLMGHSSSEITAEIYTHVDDEMTQEAGKQLNRFYAGRHEALTLLSTLLSPIPEDGQKRLSPLPRAK